VAVPFQVPGLAGYQHRLRVAKVCGDVAADVIADRAGIPPGDASPACPAMVQQFLRSNSASSPSTNARALRRDSTLGKRAARGHQIITSPHKPG
jgi:hypothetical protein